MTDPSTLRLEEDPPATSRVLLVLGEERTFSVPLPDSGRLTLGRAEPSGAPRRFGDAAQPGPYRGCDRREVG